MKALDIKKVTTLAVEEGMYVLMLSSPIITTADFNYLDHLLVHAESYNYVTLVVMFSLFYIASSFYCTSQQAKG